MAAFCQAVAEVATPIHEEFAASIVSLNTYVAIEKTPALAYVAWSGTQSPGFDEPIITQFVIPAVLTALRCQLRYPDPWSGAVDDATGLGGDVDTLGVIVGASMGATLGIKAIASHLADTVVDTRRFRQAASRFFAAIEVNCH